MRVLVIDQDAAEPQSYSGAFSAAGCDVVVATRWEEGLEIARVGQVDLVVSQIRLPDVSGRELMRDLKATRLTVPFLLVNGTLPALGSSLSVGAVPPAGDVAEVVRHALSGGADPAAGRDDDTPLEFCAVARWANTIPPVIDARSDPNTIAAWARLVAVSRGALKNWCATAGISTRRSLVLARLMRAIARRQRHGCALQDSLNVVDRRTLTRLLRLGGIASGHPVDVPTTIEAFIQQQELIRQPAAIEQLTHLLRRHPSWC